MKFAQALNEAEKHSSDSYLIEGFRRYSFNYKGTRPWYKIHDKRPFILAIDDNYNVDNKGRSILGINMHYFDGSPSRKSLFYKINKIDNLHGYKGFDAKMSIDRDEAEDKDKFDAENAGKRIERYNIFKTSFPQLLPYLRRYKYNGINGIRRTKEDDVSLIWKNVMYNGKEGD